MSFYFTMEEGEVGLPHSCHHLCQQHRPVSEMLALGPKESALSHEHKSMGSPPVIQDMPQLPHVGLSICPLASCAQGMWLVQAPGGSGWDSAAGKEKAQQETPNAAHPSSVVRAPGFLPATLSRDFGLSLAVALAQLSISMAHPLFLGHDDSGKEPFCNHCQGLPCGTGNSPHCGKNQQLPHLPLTEAHPSPACTHQWLPWALAESPWWCFMGTLQLTPKP